MPLYKNFKVFLSFQILINQEEKKFCKLFFFILWPINLEKKTLIKFEKENDVVFFS